MDSAKRFILSIVAFTLIIITLARASNMLKVSGGEDHTLVLAENKFVWACGANYSYQLGTDNSQDQWTLIQVEGGAMGTPHLQDINNIAAGWMHSLALDTSDFVWAWGDDGKGHRGPSAKRTGKPGACPDTQSDIQGRQNPV